MKPLEDLVLGLDIGARSVGWALVRENGHEPIIVAAGVRVFPLGVDEQTLESRNIERRLARQRRRLLARRVQRLQNVRRLLSRAGFLPSGAPGYEDPNWKRILVRNPYHLRSEGLRRRLDPWEFGRAIYHLAHRRGFKSNRKTSTSDAEAGRIRQSIAALEREIQASGAETLGDFLARLNPHEQRIRERYTAREWYRREFDLIIERQRQFGLELPDDLAEGLRRAIFFQRKVRWDPATLGHCEFEKRRLRARVSLPVYQRFRILQNLNNLRIQFPEGTERALTPEEREQALRLLNTSEMVRFTELRRALKLPAGSRFNLEDDERKALEGNVTETRIRAAIGRKWDESPENIKQAIYEAVASIEDEDLLKRVALSKPWGLTPEEAERLSEVVLEDERGRLSSLAVRKLLPHLEAGLTYAEAVQKVYPGANEEPQVDRVPPFENLRNPTVQRALAETRRVVNAVLKRHGRPGRIRIELARDLKKPQKERLRIQRAMARRAAERTRARERILKEAGIPDPSPADIEKVLLFEECGGACPYTGRQIAFADLFGPDPKFEVEHIIPWSRSLDNFFANKTLCAREANREKHNRTPYEAFGGSPRYDEILARVKRFKGPFAEEKLLRFECTDPEKLRSELLVWTGADLNAASWAARKAAEHLARFYPPDERRSHIQVSAGRTTAGLRAAWRLNALLGMADEKNRADHRHHALDAIVVALTTPAITRQLTEAAKRALRPGTFVGMELPESVRKRIEDLLAKMVVSHRVDRRLQGPLHEESHYGLIRANGQVRVVIRKRLTDLNKNMIERIVDPVVRRLVKEAVGDGDPQTVFKEPTRWPRMPNGAGRLIRIRRVRIFVDEDPNHLLHLEPSRVVKPGGNHHLEIFAVRDRNGQPAWKGVIVSRFEAMRRKLAGEPVVRRIDEAGNPLVFSLAIGDTVELMWKGEKKTCGVQKLSERDYVFREVHDGRRAADIGEPIRIRSDRALFASNCHKLTVDPLGEIRTAHD